MNIGERDIVNRLMDMGGRVRWVERVTWKLIIPYVRWPMGICRMSQEIQTRALYQARQVG